MVRAKWPWILAGLGFAALIVPVVIAGSWLANGGLERLSAIFDEDSASRERLPIWSRMLEDPEPLEPEKAAGATAVYLDEGSLWARAFGSPSRELVIADPKLLGYSDICCFMGPDEEGRVLGYGTSLDEQTGEVFEVQLSTGEFRVVYRQEDIEDLIAYFPSMSSGRVAVWEEGPLEADGSYVGGKVMIFDSQGGLIKTLKEEAHQRVAITPDGKAVYTLLERARPYADWLKDRRGPAPDPQRGRKENVLVRINVDTERVEEIGRADDFNISWDGDFALVWEDDNYYAVELKSGSRFEAPWPEYWLHTSDSPNRDLLYGLHIPWPKDSDSAHKRCDDAYGVISAIEPSTSKIATLDVMCYEEWQGPSLTFGPWSGAAKRVRSR